MAGSSAGAEVQIADCFRFLLEASALGKIKPNIDGMTEHVPEAIFPPMCRIAKALFIYSAKTTTVSPLFGKIIQLGVLELQNEDIFRKSR